jgi:hypothetical protein
MDRADKIKDLVDEFASHLDTANDISEIVELSLDKIIDTIPPDRLASILAKTGKWLKVAFAPVSAAMTASTDRWFEKQVAFIKTQSGVEKISEETALALVSIRMVQIRERAESIKKGMKDSDSRSKSK